MTRPSSGPGVRALGGSPELSEVGRRNALVRVLERRLPLVLAIIALLLGFVQAWDTRFTIGRDAVSYLDMGDAYFRHDWAMAVNGYFNPLYAWLLGSALHLVRPGPYWEYPLVHLVDFLIYGFALYAFGLFLKELLRYREARLSRSVHGQLLHGPRWAWIVLGYTVFLWSSLDLINSYKGEVTPKGPDMLIAGFVYLVGALLVRIRAGSATWATFVGLGAVCGAGYLTKAVFLPVGIVILTVALLAAPNFRQAISRVAVALLVFFALAGPYVLALSWSKRRLTFGDTGRLNYAWYVNGTALRHWQGSPGTGTPLHPTRVLFKRPATYEFATPVGGTYPVWYDASYWYEGLRIRFSIRRQLKVLAGNLQELATFLLRLNGSLTLGIFLLAVTSGKKRLLVKEIGANWFLILPCAAAVVMYSLVTLESRYVGAFLAVIVLSVFLSIPLRDTPETRNLFAGVAIGLLLMFLSPIGPSAIPHRYGSLLNRGEPGDKSASWRVASEIRKVGIHPGDRVASIQYPKKDHMAWARLARARIVAEVFYSPTMPSTLENDFFRASPAVQNQIIEAFRRAGAKLVVSDEQPPGEAGSEPADDWKPLGETGFYAYLLTPAPNASSAGRGPADAPQTPAGKVRAPA